MDHVGQQHATSDGFLLPPLPTSSSPANAHLLSPTRTSRRKEKRDPSVTPRRFGRFFTPRNSQPITGRRILANVASEDLNRQPLSPTSLLGDGLSSDPIVPSSPSRSPRGNGRKRSSPGQSSVSPIVERRGLILGDMQPPRLNLPERTDMSMTNADHLEECRRATLNRFFKTSRGQDHNSKDVRLLKEAFRGPSNKRQRLQSPERHVPIPIRKFTNRGLEAHLLDREHGFSSHAGRVHLATPACDARAHSANFHSNPADTEMTTSYERGAETTPFCQTSFNRSPVTAIGDEQGFVRLFRTDGWTNSQQNKVESFFKAQDNAIIDVDVSADDKRLATACGDWSGRIFDMTTQSPVVDLRGHTSGMRQILFQPGQANGHILATAAKDGCINIWDLRCAGLPTNAFSTGDTPRRATRRNVNLDIYDAKPINSMDLAHVRRAANGHHTPASITALQWFPSGREHLIASGSESSAAIKLWDIRCIKPRHKEEAIPLSITSEPRHHTFRSYGLTSLALSGDATRLYSVCKDNTIYAYSTAHLILGQAPELIDSAVKRKPRAMQGPGPLYGWKNERLSGISFWVKSALRPATSHTPEMLAVGGDKAPILFPTDETFMKTHFSKTTHILPQEALSTPSTTLTTTPSRGTPSSLTPASANIPIFKCGTPLVNGHEKEVSTVSWTNEGRLVSLSDDGSVRHWQDDDGGVRARYLRSVGEFGGERWNCGWADVGDWDEEDE